jgi:hypothetical protein
MLSRFFNRLDSLTPPDGSRLREGIVRRKWRIPWGSGWNLLNDNDVSDSARHPKRALAQNEALTSSSGFDGICVPF